MPNTFSADSIIVNNQTFTITGNRLYIGGSGITYSGENFAGYINNSNLAGFVQSGQLETTGTALQNQFNILASNVGLTGWIANNINGGIQYVGNIKAKNVYTSGILDGQSIKRIEIGNDYIGIQNTGQAFILYGDDNATIINFPGPPINQGIVLGNYSNSFNFNNTPRFLVDRYQTIIADFSTNNRILINDTGTYLYDQFDNDILGTISGFCNTGLSLTGTTLINLINIERNKNTITGISITGGIGITGFLNLTAGSNISLTQQGSDTLSISSSAGGGSTVLNAITGFGTLNFLPKFTTNNSGITNSNITSIDSYVGINASSPREELEISGGILVYNSNSINFINATGNLPSYQQINTQNQSNQKTASTDLVATNDIGTESTFYVDLGINSSTYSGGFIGYSGDGYLYSQANDFYIGNAATGTNIKNRIIFFAGTSPTGIDNCLMVMQSNQVRISGNAFASGGKLLTTLDSGNLRSTIELTGTSLQGEIATLNTSTGFLYNQNFNKGTCFFNSDGIPTGGYNIPIWRAPYACTITGIHGFRLSGNGATINAVKNNATSHLTTNLSITSTGAWISSGIILSSGYVEGDSLTAQVISVTDFPIAVSIQVDFVRA